MRWFLIFTFCVQPAGAVILVQAPGVKSLEYRAALKADSSAMSPTAHFLKARALPWCAREPFESVRSGAKVFS